MKNHWYESFGKLGKLNTNLTSGRYSWMNNKYNFIIKDIKLKLNLNSNDYLLDIGCGNAKIIDQLSKYVKKSSAIDHPDIISSLSKKKRIKYYKGDIFKDYNKINQKFSKILIYSLIHYLKDKKELFKLINICMKKLKPEGILMIGDIPNYNKKLRFKKLKVFNKITKQWNKIHSTKKFLKEKKFIDQVIKDKPVPVIKISDGLISEIYKKYTNDTTLVSFFIHFI